MDKQEFCELHLPKNVNWDKDRIKKKNTCHFVWSATTHLCPNVGGGVQVYALSCFGNGKFTYTF